MLKLEDLRQSYLDRLFIIQYNYATELLENISDFTYGKLLEKYPDLFETIEYILRDLYVHRSDVFERLIPILELAVSESDELDLARLEMLSYLLDLPKDLLDKVYDFIEHHLED